MGTKEQVAIRQHLIEEIEADLIGPRIGNTKEKRSFEILPRNRSPENEYVAGVLFPGNWQVGDEEIDQEMADDDNDDNSSSNVSNDKLFKPSSFGLTCRLAPETKKIEIVIQYGEYDTLENKHGEKIYQRTPKTENFPILIKPIKECEEKFTNNSNFCINYTIIQDENSTILDFYVVNKTELDLETRRSPLTDFIFQPKIFLESVNDELSFIPITDGVVRNFDPPSDKHLDILFRDKISYGKGHLCAVVWDKKNIKNRCINKINTSFIPQEEIDLIEPSSNKELKPLLEMNKLGSCKDKNELHGLIYPIIENYEAWVKKTGADILDSKEFDGKENKILGKQLWHL